MLPGPYNLPPVPPLPFYIHPAVFWGLVLLAAILFAVALLRFIFSSSSARVNSFFALFLVIVFLVVAYLVFINGPTILQFFHRLTQQMFVHR